MPVEKKQKPSSGDINRYLSKRRKELVAKIFILQDLMAQYRFSIPKYPTLEFELNHICFNGPLHDMMSELRVIDGPKKYHA